MTETDTSAEGIADMISVLLTHDCDCDCDALSECQNEDCALSRKVCRTLRTLLAERDRAKETLEGRLADIPEAWGRIQDAALHIHEDGGRDLAHLVFGFQSTLRALVVEKDNLRASRDELLETLEQIEAGLPAGSSLVDGRDPLWRDAYRELQRTARAAIAKARGQRDG